MLDSLRALSDRSNASSGEGDDRDPAAALDGFLQDGESVAYVLVSDEGIEYSTDERTTTIEPGRGHDAFGVVTDHRVLFLVESDADESPVDVEFDLESITRAEPRDSLLSTSFVVVAEGTDTVKFRPAGNQDLEEIGDYVERIGGSWADLHESLAATRRAVDEFEERRENGQDAHEALTSARSRLSNAHHCATRNDDGPVEAMLGRVEPLEAELDGLQVETRLDRVDELLDEADDAVDAGDYEAAVDALAAAGGRLAATRDAVDGGELENEESSADFDRRVYGLATVVDDLLGDALAACHRAQDADDPDEAAAAWARALDGYRSLADADWDGVAGVDETPLRFQIAWVVGRRIDALGDRAAALEAAGDDLGGGDGEARDRYEAAKAAVEAARTLAREHDHTSGERFADDLDRLDEKIARTEWEWGGD